MEMNQAIALEEGDRKLVLRTRYAKENGEGTFILDLDAFEEGEIPFEGLAQRLDLLHDLAYAGFRWSIVGENLNRFQPIQPGGR